MERGRLLPGAFVPVSEPGLGMALERLQTIPGD